MIIGYSGWDDAITRALNSVGQFDHNLYWCDRGSTLEASGLSPIAADILKKHGNAFYVPIEGADRLMLELHQALTGHTLPRLFREPIGVVRSQLELCDLTGMTVSSRETSGPSGGPTGAGRGDTATSGSGRDTLDLGEEVKSIQRRLEDMERLFKGAPATEADAAALLAAQVRQRLAVATDLYFSNKYREALPHLDFILEHADSLDASEKAWTLFRRGLTYGRRGEAGDAELATADFTAVIEMADAPAEVRARARIIRGISYGERGEAGDAERESADYTAVINMPDASAEQRANAQRGLDLLKRRKLQ